MASKLPGLGVAAIPLLISAGIMLNQPTAPSSDTTHTAKPANIESTSAAAVAREAAPSLTPECEDGVESIDDCPDTGCSELGSKLGDAELNKEEYRIDAFDGHGHDDSGDQGEAAAGRL